MRPVIPHFRSFSQRGGAALLGALLATIVIAALLASLFFAASEETRTGSAIGRRDRALAAAESAIEIGLDRLGTWPPEYPAVGGVETHSVDADGIPSVVHITRLDSSLFWLVAVVGDASDPAAVTRRIGVLATATRHASDSIAIVRRAERGWSELF
jgi:hypothetical protein